MNRRHAWIVCAASVIVAGASHALRPTELLAQRLGDINLEAMVPENFGPWRRDLSQSVGVVDPQVKDYIDTIYSRTLTRTYVTDDGYRIMLSIAYSLEHRQGKESLHRPELCYPAAGFNILQAADGQVVTPHGNVPVRRLVTQLGATRPEPVTYWLTLGEHAAMTGVERRLASLRYTSRGLIPDGLFFRVSSIDPTASEAFARQDQFVRDLIAVLPPEHRRRLAGLGTD